MTRVILLFAHDIKYRRALGITHPGLYRHHTTMRIVSFPSITVLQSAEDGGSQGASLV